MTATEEENIYFLDFQHTGLKKLNFLEFLFNGKKDGDLLYARNEAIKQALEEAVLYRDGIPYLSPEMCLLYKSTDTEREGYQDDYDRAMAVMDRRQKRWLNDALTVMYPQGHKWRSEM